MTFPIAFHLTHQPNPKSIKDRYGNSPTRSVIDLQKQFFQLLLREPITLSLRYISDPNATADQRLQIFLLINIELKTQPEQEQLKRRLLSTIQSSEFYQIYLFQEIELNTHQFPTLQKLDWVNALVEIPKAETISPKGYYLPRLFPENQDHDMVKICELLSRIRSERFLLEITLQPHNNPSERQKALDAIESLLKAQSKSGSSAKDAILDTVIKSAQNHQSNYSHQPLFTYSIKLLAEQEHSLSNLAITWLQNATNSDYANLYHNLPILKRGSPEFQKSLQATRDVRILPQSSQYSPALQAWQQQFGSQSISKIFGSKSMFGDGSTSYSNPTPPPQNPQSFLNPTSSSSLVSSGGSHALAKPMATQGWDRPQQSAVTMQDLLPLRHLVTLDEVSNFLRVVIPQNKLAGMAMVEIADSTPNNFPALLTIDDVIRRFGHLITEDTYVAGVDRDGNPCVSSFADSGGLAHRLVGGMTRTGKTNYILSVIYQFLYADLDREIFMIDFQDALHYEFTIQKRKNVKMVTTFEDCNKLLKEMLEKHSLRRQKMKDNKCRGRKELFEKTGIKQNRVLLVIDEAFYIKNADRDYQKSIEKNLNTLAAQAGVTGIHIIYSTQSPTSDVIDSQTLNNIGERVLFAIESPSDSRRIIGTDEAYELPLVPKGRALFRGIDRLPIQIATPFVPDEVW